MKRVIINGMTGSSRRFKRFERYCLLLSLQIQTLLFCFEMDYINFQAEVEGENVSTNEELTFSDNENNFINDSNEECNHPPSFYKFVIQTRDPVEAVNDDNGSQFDRRDLQLEMFFTINREHLKFEEFDDAKKCVEKF